jgi:hypothetical protein
MPSVTAAVAHGIAAAKFREHESDAERWTWIALYLDRVKSFYASERNAAERDYGAIDGPSAVGDVA